MAADSSQQLSQQGSVASTLSQNLHELQKLLDIHSSSTWSVTDPAAADALLGQLKKAAAAAAAAVQHADQQQQRLCLLTCDSSTELQACSSAAVGCLQSLAGVLLQPRAELYSGLGEAPCEPAEGLELAGEQQQLIAAAQLQLMALLLGLFKGLNAPATAEQQQEEEQQQKKARADMEESRSRNRPHYFQGIVEIEELPAEDPSSKLTAQQQLQQQVVRLLLAVALYAADSNTAAAADGHASCQSSSSSSSSASADYLECFCDSIVQAGLKLNTPWAGSSCQQQAQQLLQQVVETVSIPHSSTDSSGSGSGGSKGDAGDHRKQQQQRQRLWCHLLPLLLDELRDDLLAQHRHRKLQDKGDMVAYTGPCTFRRCLSARQLAYLVQQLQPPALTDPHTLGLLLPLILAVADDPSPAVRQYSHSALGWLGWTASSSSSSREGGLQWQDALLKAEARRLVVGCEESCWGTAMPAATSLLLALEGRDQRSTAYHSLVIELVREAERTAFKPQPRLVFMACVARLLPQLGLYVVRHLAALMPLLLEWTHAYDEQSSVVALQLLALLVKYAWPRMVVHAGVIRKHVGEVLGQEQIEQGPRQQQQQQHKQRGCSRRYKAGQLLLQMLDAL